MPRVRFSLVKLGLGVSALLAAAMLALAACTTNTTTVSACPTSLPFSAALVYPASTATRVPQNVGVVVVQGGFQGHTVSIAVISPYTGLITQVPIGPPPVPLPSPLATPVSVIGYPLGSIPLPPLNAYTTYGVTLVALIPANPTCPAVNVPIGYFTTAL